MQVDLDQWVKQ